jgi:hypothetical protein
MGWEGWARWAGMGIAQRKVSANGEGHLGLATAAGTFQTLGAGKKAAGANPLRLCGRHGKTRVPLSIHTASPLARCSPNLPALPER